MGDSRPNRVFHYAIAASLALHALVLFGFFPDLVDSARRAVTLPPLIARLMEPEPAAPPPAPVEPERPKAVTPKPRPVKPVPEPAPVSPPAPAREAPAPAAPAPAAPAAPPVAASAPQPAAPAQPAEPPESLSRDQYRLELLGEARRHKRYPPLARENNWQGQVRVGVAIAANGRPTVTLKGSSGYEVLDKQALEMFRQAARAVPVPPALRGKEFALEVGAIYGLEE